MAQPVKGVTYPKKLYPSVQAADHDVGGVRGTDYENAGQIDATNDNVAALSSRVSAAESKLAQRNYEQLGGVQTGTGADQKILHGLGVVPSMIQVIPVAGFGSEDRYDIVSADENSVTVKVTDDCEFRLYVFR